MRGAATSLESGVPPAARPEDEVRTGPAYASVVHQLIVEFGDRIPAGVIAQWVAEEAAHFEDARIPAFLPILIQRAVKQRIDHCSTADAGWPLSETDSAVGAGSGCLLDVEQRARPPSRV